MSNEPKGPRRLATPDLRGWADRIEERLAAGELGLPKCKKHGEEGCPACEEEALALQAAEEEARWLARDRGEALRRCGVPEVYSQSFRSWAPMAWRPGEPGEPWAVVVHGLPGSGKTCHAAELLWRWLRSRREEGELFVRAAKVPGLAYGEDRIRAARLGAAPFLIVDDLGRGYKGDAALAIGELIEERYCERRPTVFTTNGAAELELGSAEMADRLRTARKIALKGGSRRASA